MPKQAPRATEAAQISEVAQMAKLPLGITSFFNNVKLIKEQNPHNNNNNSADRLAHPSRSWDEAAGRLGLDPHTHT